MNLSIAGGQSSHTTPQSSPFIAIRFVILLAIDRLPKNEYENDNDNDNDNEYDNDNDNDNDKNPKPRIFRDLL